MQSFAQLIRRLTSVLTLGLVFCLTLSGWKYSPAAENTDGDETVANPEQSAAADARFDLSADWKPGETRQITAALEVGGHLTVTGTGTGTGAKKVQQLPMSVVAKLNYLETLLVSEPAGKRHLRSARRYSTAEAVIKVDKGGITPALPADHRELLVDLVEGQVMIYRPTGSLTRDQLDLVNIVGNTLALNELLPVEPVLKGEKWKATSEAITAVLGLDAVASCEVESELTEVVGDLAKVTLAGTVSGAAEGVATEIEVKAKYIFNLSSRQITGFNLAVREKRSIGHVGPGVEVVAKLKMQLQPAETPAEWADISQAEINVAPTPENTRLLYQAEQSGFQFYSEPRWFVTNEATKLLVLRHVDRGDLIAQCNLTPLPADNPEKPLTLEQYQHEVRHALGKNFGQFTRAGQWTDEAGQLVYRVVVQGQVDTLPIEWRYYLITNSKGQRVAAVFTIEGELLDRFAEADRQLVDTLTVQEPVTKSPAPAEPPTAATPEAIPATASKPSTPAK